MITRTKITLAILIITLAAILVAYAVNTPDFSITENAHEIIVCSIEAIDRIESAASELLGLGESTGLIWTPEQNCIVYSK